MEAAKAGVVSEASMAREEAKEDWKEEAEATEERTEEGIGPLP